MPDSKVVIVTARVTEKEVVVKFPDGQSRSFPHACPSAVGLLVSGWVEEAVRAWSDGKLKAVPVVTKPQGRAPRASFYSIAEIMDDASLRDFFAFTLRPS
ncbi:hypothetical protein A2348_05000 [Candidatus Uhrbacteria bacterium RIFOXYB12_FULL_58_10]|uniref:Uncharacterized protein n=1 Tax=Candidatus Uhrbacteria bacterium RIFOXYB2_FULL_57_15 TaxID=1802422 RepID=A0A1F7W867_9BACT|nr:MAG: hypothetical protein A2348_05000 [Candidatus Uhrbacteria bacterium RIFOXYB12_FULL_58_10]OGL98826.1 MAG: hypothetical protein A2304_05020 [Candidatus Uhrbacteria bacterium RIFOXYB2_FULL_57_15]OGM00299.1 MAG: hypothetical protein A2501_02080 [Candidatus Uhrbacteria bacterium RIFOXYC12_FULL_57_11]